jgi:hypothetical protein
LEVLRFVAQLDKTLIYAVEHGYMTAAERQQLEEELRLKHADGTMFAYAVMILAVGRKP